MSIRENIDDILRDWPYDPHDLNVRIIMGDDGRDVIQMRVDMGILQLEMQGRPDGLRPYGAATYFDFLQSQVYKLGEQFELSEEDCSAIDREFVQFYHRRICWLKLQNYRRAVLDADHTLAMMDFCTEHSEDEAWIMSHEQYRPFVLFHRTQAVALAELEDDGPKAAIGELDRGLERLHKLFVRHEAEEHFDDDELVHRLQELRSSLIERDEGSRLRQQLKAAVAAEEYELAARLRDQLASLDED